MRTHELVGLLYDKHGVVVVPQPDGGMGAGGTTTDHDNIAVDGVAAALGGAGGSRLHEERGGHEAGATPHPAGAHCVSTSLVAAEGIKPQFWIR